MSKFEQFLMEMPLPQEWDKSVFKKSYAAQIKYAKEKAAQIGTGSSRVAFIIPYEGRDTVLKIAKNKKGLAQNEKEADYGLHRMHGSVLIPLIDHDKDNAYPTWIHFEKADKLTAKTFQQMTGMDFQKFGMALQNWEQEHNGKRPIYKMDSELKEQIEESELYEEVTNMVSNYDFLVGDFTRLANWGIYKGKPVIIDYGYDANIQKEYYSVKGVQRW